MNTAKVFLLGIDGATFDLLHPLTENGTMPNLKKIFNGGAWAELNSTPNPLTPPAWISMVTGTWPATHGVYDFMHPKDNDDGSVSLRFTDSRDILSDLIWEIVSRYSYNVNSLNFYSMSPTRKIKGNLISGFLPWRHLRRGTYPSQLFDEIKTLQGIDIKLLGMDMSDEKKTVIGIPKEEEVSWIEQHTKRNSSWTRVLQHLEDKYPSDLSAIVYDGPDKIQHLFWRFMAPKLKDQFCDEHSQCIKAACMKHFAMLDKDIGQLMETMGANANIIVASDHGFGDTTEVVYLNQILNQLGYLKWSSQSQDSTSLGLAPDRLKDHMGMIDWQNTYLYCPTPSSNAIYLTKRGRREYSNSTYALKMTELKETLLTFVDPEGGKPIFSNVHLNASRLDGQDCHETEPDILVRLRDGGFVSVLKSNQVVKQRRYPEGTHRPNGVFACYGPAFKAKGRLESLDITDITPIILRILQIPKGDKIEGNVPDALLNEEWISSKDHPQLSLSITRESSTAEEDNISAAEKEAIMEQLKTLGYME